MLDWLRQYWLGVLFATITGGLGCAVKWLWYRQKASNAGLQALLHDRIFTIYGDCENKGYATVEEKRNIDYLYNPYHNLGGNGTGTELYTRVMKMPDRPAEQEA